MGDNVICDSQCSSLNGSLINKNTAIKWLFLESIQLFVKTENKAMIRNNPESDTNYMEVL